MVQIIVKREKNPLWPTIIDIPWSRYEDLWGDPLRRISFNGCSIDVCWGVGFGCFMGRAADEVQLIENLSLYEILRSGWASSRGKYVTEPKDSKRLRCRWVIVEADIILSNTIENSMTMHDMCLKKHLYHAGQSENQAHSHSRGLCVG